MIKIRVLVEHKAKTKKGADLFRQNLDMIRSIEGTTITPVCKNIPLPKKNPF